jgi:geranyl-CoA carboxylase alpha subunit
VPELPGVRVDAGIASGDEVSPFYDAMVAKIMAVGETREDARQRLLRALEGSALFGVGNNRDFLIDVLKQREFVDGAATTAFIGDHYGDRFELAPPPSEDLAAAAAIQHCLERQHFQATSLSVSPELMDWCSTGTATFSRCYQWQEDSLSVVISAESAQAFSVAVGEQQHRVEDVELGGGVATMTVDGARRRFSYAADSHAALNLASEQRSYHLVDTLQLPPESAEAGSGGTVQAPMHGLLLSVDVAAGDTVEAGQRLAVLEAMKMQHEITASVNGSVVELVATAGQQLAAGDLILTIEEAE